ncbi:MAG: methylated-DNA--[protein]-cysteine S-methyltransferase [Egibacteraceae bacterium]
MTPGYVTTMPSPVGELTLVSDGERLTGLYLPVSRSTPVLGQAWRSDPGPFQAAVEQLAAYFAGERTIFDLPVAPQGTAFQLQVWKALQEIPYGQTRSYGAIAERIGNPRAVRAVGLANGRNPIAIVIPCHRVIGANGSLTGYGGGLDRKRLLLRLESAHV